jgi:hypothetical protein
LHHRISSEAKYTSTTRASHPETSHIKSVTAAASETTRPASAILCLGRTAEKSDCDNDETDGPQMDAHGYLPRMVAVKFVAGTLSSPREWRQKRKPIYYLPSPTDAMIESGTRLGPGSETPETTESSWEFPQHGLPSPCMFFRTASEARSAEFYSAFWGAGRLFGPG